MAIQVRMVSSLTWRGDQWFNNQLMPGLASGVREAAQIYYKEIQGKLDATWGSVTTRNPNKRLRVTHSPPGSAPYKQTSNLAQSVRTTYNFNLKPRGNTHTLKARVSTDVRYAPTLEFGGSLSVPQRTKKYTTIRLVNPLKPALGSIYIAPRPAWTPAFTNVSSLMVSAIARHIRQ